MISDTAGTPTAVDITGIATVALALATLMSVIVAIVLGRRAAQDATASRDAQAFLQIYQGYFRSPRGARARQLIANGFTEPPLLSDRDLVAEAYGYYELLAIYIDEGLIDERLTRKIFKGALTTAAERRDEWLKWWKPGGPRELYGVHLCEMVRRWPESIDDAGPRHVLLKPYVSTRPSRFRRTANAVGRLRKDAVRATTMRALFAFAAPIGASVALAIWAAVRKDLIGALIWIATLLLQFVVLRAGRRPDAAETSPVRPAGAAG